MNNQYDDFYTRLREKIRKWAESKQGHDYKWSEYILLAPDLVHLMIKLLIDAEVPTSLKSKIAFALAYFILPLDIIPEALTGPVGYIDDIALSAYVLSSVLNNLDPMIVRRYWAGDEDILNIVQRILLTAEDMIGKGIWQKLKKYL
ncbi:DUF1232 domain-containing protein [candidate division KSB1 bacterium]|nr:DUF1232 domain-containing protein [candidate division KSB1 bacterium]